MNEFEKSLSTTLGAKNLESLQGVKIGIAGCGGLGSNVAFNLVRSGFKRFVLADFDVIEYSNLNRQFFFYDQVGHYKSKSLAENLLRINPDLHIEVHTEQLNSDLISSLYGNCDAVVEAFDMAPMKRLIVDTLSDSDILLVSASGLSGWDDADKLVTRRLGSKFYVIGDFQTETNPETPPISPRVNIAAAKQANIVLSHFMKNAEVQNES